MTPTPRLRVVRRAASVAAALVGAALVTTVVVLRRQLDRARRDGRSTEAVLPGDDDRDPPPPLPRRRPPSATAAVADEDPPDTGLPAAGDGPGDTALAAALPAADDIAAMAAALAAAPIGERPTVADGPDTPGGDHTVAGDDPETPAQAPDASGRPNDPTPASGSKWAPLSPTPATDDWAVGARFGGPQVPTGTADEPPPTAAAPDAPSNPAAPAGPLGRRRILVLVAVAAVLVTTAAGLAIAGAGDDGTGGGDTASTGAPGTDDATTSTAPPPPAPEAFRQASRRLETAASFSYGGVVHTRDVSVARPSPWLAVDLTVRGEVVAADGRMHEVAVAPDGRAVETVGIGADVWGRTAPAEAGLTAATYQTVPPRGDPEAPRTGLTLLPLWLAAGRDPHATGVDDQGRPVYRATLPGGVLGEVVAGVPPTDAEIVLTLDPATGDPARVALSSRPDGSALGLVLDISGIGAPVTITPPTDLAGPDPDGPDPGAPPDG